MVRSTCSPWFGLFGGGETHKFRNIEAREGSFGKENQGICVCSRFRVSYFLSVLISFVGLVQLTSLNEILYRK